MIAFACRAVLIAPTNAVHIHKPSHGIAVMTVDLLIALTGFAFVTVITPGPNNLMLMTSGANFGFRRTVPHMLGIGLGFPTMVFLVGIGVMQVFDLWPLSYVILKIVSVAYLLYLAWKIANAAPPKKAEAEGRPLTFLQSAAFQWVNPKAWSMALSAVTLYATGRDLVAVLWVACLVDQHHRLDRSGATAAPVPEKPGAPARVQLDHGGVAGHHPDPRAVSGPVTAPKGPP
jgi:threonine/homoserine/homoserine lactone efflux protein